MAMNYQNFASLGVNLNRQKYGPLDISNVFTSAADLKYYLTKGTFTEGVSEYWYKSANEKIVPYPYEGQVLATVIDGVVSVYALSLDAEGNFQTQEIGAKVEVDGTTIVKDENGKLSIVAPVDPDSSKTYNFAYANGVYSWVEVDTATAAGQAQAIAGLTDRTVALEEAINGKGEGEERVAGLVEKVAANAQAIADEAAAREAAIGKAAEGEAAATGVYAAIDEALQAAKDYADQNDADTKYDDTALAARVKAIEDDYIKAEDKYDDSDVRELISELDEAIGNAEGGLVKDIADEKARAEAAEKALDEKINAIDFIDADELATALTPYAKTADVESALADKADKTALEALQNTVDAFLTGEGTEAALDSLKELIAYIDEHDGADLTEMIATIEGIEGKLVGIDGTVADYVTAAINALKIGDYAKAADLTALAERVAALEAKPFDTYATKTEVQDVDAKFADYTTTPDLTGLLADKADADSVVANDTFESFKTANAEAISAARTGAVSDVEAKGYAVDADVKATYATKAELETHESEIANDLLAYAKTADVNAELAKKVDKATISHTTEEKAEGATVNGTQLDIVVDAFTKAETRQYVADTISQMTGGESAADVLLALNNYKDDNDERVGAIETKNSEQDTAIATAQAQADKGVANAAKVASDLASLDARVVSNTNEIAAVKGTITTVNETLSGKVANLEAKDVELAGLITGLDTSVKSHATTIGEHTAAITALQAKDTELLAAIQANTDKFADYSTTEQVNKAIDDKIAAIPAVDFTGYATETYVTDAIAVVNGEVAKKANAADVYTITAADAKFVAEADFESKVDARVNTLIDGANSEDTITNVTNLIEFVNDNAGDIAKLVTDVENNGKAIEANASAIATNKAAHEKNAEDIVAINALIAANEVKASAEISVAAVDGEGATGVQLGIKEVNVNKLVQTAGDTLVLNGGSAV